ncbi:nucleic acid dioxygenase ALKBH1 isoform X2 [Adelges cooleyi]|uniref:nucleic acid dioxygenase ALKBH1 isoform X2 n=1 Tax=Adelges cooleyi TaxID=133065 RepID=UPI00218053A1|nr:nucleic acid dioxygenase ALKBH1 isoform X2 [Adelges cooleyi]
MFKERFKYYKHLNSIDKSDTIDLDKLDEYNIEFVKPKKILTKIYDNGHFNGLGLNNDLSSWKCYDITQIPGLVCIRNPFTEVGQKLWIKRCVANYTRKPNVLNIDAHHLLEADEDWWTTVNKTGDLNLRNKLRWSTLGYHHNWDSKVYSESAKSEFPPELARLSKTIIKVLQFPNDFVAEAAIVNFYHPSSILCGHTDQSEYNLEAPLLSISFGLSAIFLIGGASLDDKPIAILLKTGDIVIMSDKSRLSYHGVPKVLLSQYNEYIDDSCAWQPFKSFMECTRINVNVRQVNNY